MTAIAEMMCDNIVMPGHLMHDGRDPQLFTHFSAVSQRIGVYTVSDYIDNVEVRETGRFDKRAQDLVGRLPPNNIKNLQERCWWASAKDET